MRQALRCAMACSTAARALLSEVLNSIWPVLRFRRDRDLDTLAALTGWRCWRCCGAGGAAQVILTRWVYLPCSYSVSVGAAAVMWPIREGPAVMHCRARQRPVSRAKPPRPAPDGDGHGGAARRVVLAATALCADANGSIDRS